MPSNTKQVSPSDLHIRRPWSYTTAVVAACTAIGVTTGLDGGFLFLIAFAARFVLPAIVKRALPDSAVNLMFTTKEGTLGQGMRQVFMRESYESDDSLTIPLGGDPRSGQQDIEVDGMRFTPQRMTMIGRLKLFKMEGVRISQAGRDSTIEMEYLANSRRSNLARPEEVAADRDVAADLPEDLFMQNHYLRAPPEITASGEARYLRFTERCDGDLAGKPMTLTQLRETVRVVSHGLAELHGRGIVHGDLKPDQLFIKGDKVRHADYHNTKVENGQRKHGVVTLGYTMTRIFERNDRIRAALDQAGTVRHQDGSSESLTNHLSGREARIFQEASKLSKATDTPSSKGGMQAVLSDITTSIYQAQKLAIMKARDFDMEAKPVDDIYAAGLTLAEVAVQCPDLWKNANAAERQGLFTLITNCLAVARSPGSQRLMGVAEKSVIQDGAQLQEAADRWLARGVAAQGPVVASDSGAATPSDGEWAERQSEDEHVDVGAHL